MADTSIRPKLQQPFLLDDPERIPRLKRLRRVARLVAIAVLSAFAAAAVLYGTVREWQQDRAYVQTLRGDLTRLAEAERAHHEETGTFADLDDLGADFVPSQAVWMDVQVSATTWRAAARHERVDTACWVEGAVGEASTVECG